MIDVLQLARKAAEGRHAVSDGDAHSLRFDELERFTVLVLEEAAKVCKEIQRRHDGRANKAIIARNQEDQTYFEGCMVGAEDCAEAIQALKPKGEA